MMNTVTENQADVEATKLFQSKNPVIKHYMACSSIETKTSAIKRAKRFLKTDAGVPFEMARDKHLIQKLEAVPSKYVGAGYRPLDVDDIKVAKHDINDVYHRKLNALRQLVSEVLTHSEREELGGDLCGVQNGFRLDGTMDKNDNLVQSAREKLGL